MTATPFVPADFEVPEGLSAGEFRLAPLGPQHNDADYAAWTSSIDHIRATPGFPDGRWPHEMSPRDNLRDLERHAQDFASRRGFTYTVLSTDTDDVIGCVYIYPKRGNGPDGGNDQRTRADVSSWVRADHGELDAVLYRTVLEWLRRAWPFDSVSYASRP